LSQGGIERPVFAAAAPAARGAEPVPVAAGAGGESFVVMMVVVMVMTMFPVAPGLVEDQDPEKQQEAQQGNGAENDEEIQPARPGMLRGEDDAVVHE
jgi:hypothetical protein